MLNVMMESTMATWKHSRLWGTRVGVCEQRDVVETRVTQPRTLMRETCELVLKDSCSCRGMAVRRVLL